MVLQTENQKDCGPLANKGKGHWHVHISKYMDVSKYSNWIKNKIKKGNVYKEVSKGFIRRFLTLITKVLPKRTLYDLSVKMNVPKGRPRDVYETLGQDHYEINEVENDKRWFAKHVRRGGNPKGFRGYWLQSIVLNPAMENYGKIMEATKLFREKTVQQTDKDWSIVKDYFALIYI